MNRILALVIVCAAAPSFAADAPPAEKLETQKLTDNLWLVTGAGGNVAVLTGATGTLLVDDKVAPVGESLRKVIATLTPKPVRFVFNTHWHGDHTGGNALLGGDGAVIVAHDNVRKRMSTEQFNAMFNRKTPPSPEPALFANGYPFIDLSSGGSVDGVVRAADRGLALAQPSTKIIPGHGPVADARRLQQYRDMLVTIRDRVRKLVSAGKPLAEIQAAKPTAEFDAEWGHAFIKPDQLVQTIVQDATKKR